MDDEMGKKTTKLLLRCLTQLKRAEILAKEDLLIWRLVKTEARARYMERAK